MKKIATTVLLVLVIAGATYAGRRFIKNDTLNQAALSGNSNRVRQLLDKGVDVNARGMHAMTPVMSAARGGHLDIVKQLVAEGGDLNGHNDSGSVLMWAVDSGNEDLVMYLLQSGANVRWTNVSGDTALDLARDQMKTNMIRVFEEWRK